MPKNNREVMDIAVIFQELKLIRLEQVGWRARHEVLHVRGRGFAFNEDRIAHNRFVEGNRRFDSTNEVFAQRAVGPLERDFARRAVANQLSDHTVVMRRNGVAAVGV